MDPQKRHEQKFEFEASLPDSWTLRALPLLESAGLLWERMLPNLRRRVQRPFPTPFERIALDDELLKYMSPFMLLCGNALETMLKGLCVEKAQQKGESLLKNDGTFRFATHNQIALAERAGLKLSETDRQLLTVMRNYVEWCGRYPIPKKAGQHDGDNLKKSMNGAEFDRVWAFADRVLQASTNDTAARVCRERLQQISSIGTTPI